MVDLLEGKTRRRRMLAALILMGASASIGFLLGRMASWLVPIDAKPPAMSFPSDPLASSLGKAKRAEPAPTATTAGAPGAQPGSPGSGVAAQAGMREGAGKSLPSPAITLLNPGAAARGAGDGVQAEESGLGADRDGIPACEQRYASFRRSDATYQPYDGGPRRRCPLLH
jgi:hypothetical protein